MSTNKSYRLCGHETDRGKKEYHFKEVTKDGLNPTPCCKTTAIVSPLGHLPDIDSDGTLLSPRIEWVAITQSLYDTYKTISEDELRLYAAFMQNQGHEICGNCIRELYKTKQIKVARLNQILEDIQKKRG